MLAATDPEDVDYTIVSSAIFETLEQLSVAKNVVLIQQFSTNPDLIDKILLGTKRCMNSQSGIGGYMRNIISNIRNGNAECDRLIREATKKLASRI